MYAGHQTKFIRFLLVLAVVVLTIFVYASYSTNSSFSPTPAHLRAAAASSGGTGVSSPAGDGVYHNSDQMMRGAEHQSALAGKIAVIRMPPHHTQNKTANSNQAEDSIAFVKKLQANANDNHHHHPHMVHHREPTIDEDAAADGGPAGGAVVEETAAALEQHYVSNDLLEEQYVQNVENALGNINNSNNIANNGAQQSPQQQQLPPSLSQQASSLLTNQQQQQQQQQNALAASSNNNNNNLNKILDSEVLIPTSNLQKFMENADKILKNITNSPAPGQSQGAGGGAVAAAQSLAEAKQNMSSNKEIPHQDVADNEIHMDYDDEALPPSVIMTIKKPNKSPPQPPVAEEEKLQPALAAPPQPPNASQKQQPPVPPVTKKLNSPPAPPPPKVAAPKDTSKGIPTKEIYESGHLNNELDLAKLCPDQGKDLKLLILITSAPSHFEARLAIRQTWGHFGTRRDVSTAFMLGRTTNQTMFKALSQENYIYGDMIRGNFIDSYNNLTLKTISSLEWVDTQCPHAKFILKTDDDMFINVPKLLAFLDAHGKEKHVIYGRLAKKWKPIRNVKSKYFVSTSQFGAPIFPPFTTGPAYVLSNDVVHELYVRSLHQIYLKLEDVFMTGVVAQQLNIKRIHLNEFLNRRIAFNPCNIRKIISVHMIKANEQFDLWKKLLDQTTKCK